MGVSVDLDVRRFGAKGDGVTDDSTAIQRAFGAAERVSTAVTIRIGGNAVFLCRQPLVFMASNASIVIESGSVLRFGFDRAAAGSSVSWTGLGLHN